MKAGIVIIGNEILSGRTLDTNSNYLTRELIKEGIEPVKIIKISDNPELIKRTVSEITEEVDLIITTGGLGPTKDDITKKSVADVFGLKIKVDEELLKIVKKKFRSYGYKKMPSINISQAEIPENTEVFINERGTAHGLLIKVKGKRLILLPGFPSEVEYIFSKKIRPYLENEISKKSFIMSRTIRTSGIGESTLTEIIEPVLGNLENIEVAFLPSMGKVDISFTARGLSSSEMDREFEKIKKKLMPKIGKYIYGFDEEDMSENLGMLLKSKNLKIAVAESCTGGLISKMFTDVPGSSEYFERGVITYSNEAKIEILGVKKETLKKYGAVSEEIAREMAEGIKKISHADIGLSVTGIAGPAGGTLEKPLGTVFIGLCDNSGVLVRKFKFGGFRDQIRLRSARASLDLIRERINDKNIYSN